MNVFDEMGNYWAEMADQNQTEQQIGFLSSHLNPQGAILDLACGTARHLIPLSKEGFDVVGLDVSAKLLRIAKQRCRGCLLVRGDMRFLPFKAETFAAVISMDTSFGYLPSLEDDRAAIAEAQRTLKSGGCFVIDVFNRQELTQKYQGKNVHQKQKEYPNFTLQKKRTVSSEGNWLCDHWVIHNKATGIELVFEHKARLYEKSKLEEMLNTVDLAVKEVYGGYSDEKFSKESQHLILIAQKV